MFQKLLARFQRWYHCLYHSVLLRSGHCQVDIWDIDNGDLAILCECGRIFWCHPRIKIGDLEQILDSAQDFAK